MKIKKTRYLILSISFILLQITGAVYSLMPLSANEKYPFVIIVHKDNPINEISRKELSKYFLKKITKWNNGERINPVDLYADDPLRNSFSRLVHNRDTHSIKAYWQKMIFSGRAIPPPERIKESEIIEFVQNDIGAIGYISNTTSIQDYQVKKIRIKD